MIFTEIRLLFITDPFCDGRFVTPVKRILVVVEAIEATLERSFTIGTLVLPGEFLRDFDLFLATPAYNNIIRHSRHSGELQYSPDLSISIHT